MKRYVLKNGEGAIHIAIREGLPLCMLLAANPGAGWRAGSSVNIPAAGSCSFCRCITADAPLMDISERFGIPMRLILKENGVAHPSQIQAGAEIFLPRMPYGHKMYTVRGAETLADIAKTFCISEDALLRANPGIKGAYAGLQLVIPPK